jgi:hypothetical protein
MFDMAATDRALTAALHDPQVAQLIWAEYVADMPRRAAEANAAADKFFSAAGAAERTHAAVVATAAAEASLPACNGYAGTGPRCGSCKVRKGIHAE